MPPASTPPTFHPTPTKPSTFHLGTGSSLYTTLYPALLSTTHSLILTTCFWASSSSLLSIRTLLFALSANALSRRAQNPNHPKIHIRLCISSLSPLQKLLHTPSPHGQPILPTSPQWKTMQLPQPHELPGLDLRVKSIFFRPCHVLHGKYIVQDAKRVWFLSANVSWEGWGEGAIGFEGEEFARGVLRFWGSVWDGDGEMGVPSLGNGEGAGVCPQSGTGAPSLPEGNLDALPANPMGDIALATVDLSTLPPTQTLLLPHPHSPYNPFSIIFRSSATPPPTPLNTFLLTHINESQKSIQIYTPNLTYKPLINALFAAVERGVDVRIMVSRRLMILEQIVTAGTVTEWEVWRLRRRYRKLVGRGRTSDVEAMAGMETGRLDVRYFDEKRVRSVVEGRGDEGKECPVKLHLKMSIFDDEVTVLGSGNMDRASWVTSQEVGVAVFSEEVAKKLGACVRETYG